MPQDDILPIRGKFSDESQEWQVAINHVTGDPRDELWYALPDVIASVILTGRVPTLVDAFRIEPQGVLTTLMPTKLRGIIPVDPRREDFFKVVIEQRQVMKRSTLIDDTARRRLDKALKVLANSTSYFSVKK